jgi:hypothetical protein
VNDGDRGRVERFRMGIAAWNERGIESIERTWHEDVVWVEDERFPDAATRRGRDEVLERMRDRFAFIGVVEIEILDAQEIGDVLFAETVVRGRGTSSGAPAMMHSFWIYEYSDDDRVIRWREFGTRAEAEAALAETENWLH